MLMHNLTEYSDNYSKTSQAYILRFSSITQSLYQFCNDEPNNVVTESESFKFKSKFWENTNNVSIINSIIALPITYFSSLLENS